MSGEQGWAWDLKMILRSFCNILTPLRNTHVESAAEREEGGMKTICGEELQEVEIGS